MRPDAGHAVRDHLGHLEVREQRQLGIENRIERGVLRGLAAEGVQQRLRFVQVVHDGRMPLQIEVQPVAHGDLRVIDVAIVVVVDVLAPVGRAGKAVLLGLLADEVAVVPVDVAVAAVGFGGIGHHHDDVLADRVVERRLFDREAVGQFHQHLGRSGLGAVQAAGEHVDRLGLGDDAFGLGIAESARVGEAGQVSFISVEIGDGVLVGDGDDDAFAAFIGSAGGEDLDALGGSRERPVVAADIGDVGQLLGGTDVIAEDVLGAGHAGNFGQMVHQRAHELRPGGPLLDQPGVVGILRLGRLSKGRAGEEGEGREASEFHQVSSVLGYQV